MPSLGIIATQSYPSQAGSPERDFRLPINKKMTERTRTITDRLSPHLFWDIDREQFDADINSAQLIQRVLEYGELDDWRAVRDFYGLNRIASDCKTLRSLRPEALSFICLVTDTKKEDYRCYNFRQSHPTLWNS